jgi:uncharacterized HhH-GPD family protein
VVPDRLYFTDSDEANELIASDPMALLIGFALDQQVTVGQAFIGPLRLRERVGTLDVAKLAATDLEPVFKQKPAIHRYPAKMSERVHALAVHVRDEHGGDAARVWQDAADATALRANIAALPGFGEMKIKALGSVLAKRFGVAVARELVPAHPTLGDVDSGRALSEYQAAKREHKREWESGKRPPAGDPRARRAQDRSPDRRALEGVLEGPADALRELIRFGERGPGRAHEPGVELQTARSLEV